VVKTSKLFLAGASTPLTGRNRMLSGKKWVQVRRANWGEFFSGGELLVQTPRNVENLLPQDAF